ncbi:MAG: hypothetical protein C5B54_00705 [Acidobacteria bacterium]|nr:MAG: hypothetical protein C5B54_00705 [Acidobacteriota bacterium]
MKYFVALFIISYGLALYAQETITYDKFGNVAIFRPSGTPGCVVEVVSGSEGWKGDVTEIARRIAAENGCLVAGIDLNSYQQYQIGEKGFCPGGDLVGLAIYMQKTLGYKKYLPPVILGYREGSVLAYVSLAQTTNNYLGAVTFGFCPDFAAGIGRSCQERKITKRIKDKKVTFPPYNGLEVPLYVFTTSDPVSCSIDSVPNFFKNIPKVKVQPLTKDWMASFKPLLPEFMKGMPAAPKVSGVTDLPLHEYPSKGKSDTLVVILSGDGGWGDLGRDMAEQLADKNFAIIGFDTLRYFWNLRTPEESARDLNRIITTYLPAWNKKKVLLIGYSYGADLVPFMVRHLPKDTQPLVAGVALIGPSVKTEFEFNVSQLQKENGPPKGEPLLPLLKHIPNTPVYCIGGMKETDSLCHKIEVTKRELPNVSVEMVPGNHIFKNEGEEFSNKILTHFGLQ